MTKEEICENCGHTEPHNLKWGYCSQYVLDPIDEGQKNYCFCNKFKPSQGMTQEVPQNHSPNESTHEDTESEVTHGNSVKSVVNSGSDDESLSDKKTSFNVNNENYIPKYRWFYPEKDVKEVVKKLKEYLRDRGNEFSSLSGVYADVINKTDKIFGRKLIE